MLKFEKFIMTNEQKNKKQLDEHNMIFGYENEEFTKEEKYFYQSIKNNDINLFKKILNKGEVCRLIITDQT
jgi:hypothetical protein